MATVLDAFIISLNLDPKKFSEGAANAANKIDDLENRVKKLTAAEERHNEEARRAESVGKKTKDTTEGTTKASRGLEVQTARTRKKLQATTTAGADLFGMLKGGMVALGAAVGVASLDKFVKDTVTAEAGINRLGRTLGVSANTLNQWGRVAERLVPGASAGNIQAAFGRLSGEAADLQNRGIAPAGLIRAAAMMSRYNGGAPVSIMGPDGQLLPDDQILRNFADPARRAGPQNALSILGDEFGPDMTALLGLGRGRIDSELQKIKGPGDDDYAQAEHLWSSLQTFGQLLGQVSLDMLNKVLPAINRFGDAVVSATSYLTGQTTRHDFIESVSKSDPDSQPGAYNAQQAHDRATAIAGSMPFQKRDNESWGDYSRRLLKTTTFRTKTDTLSSWWKRVSSGGDEGLQKQRADRLAALMMGGMSADQARQQLVAEEGGAKPLKFPSGAPSENSLDLLDAVKWAETGSNPNQTSGAGAQGPYQLMPSVQKDYGVTNPFDEKQSRWAAGAYLNALGVKYGFDLRAELAAYNWGPGNLDKDIAANGYNWERYIPSKTEAYINKVIGATNDATIDERNRGGSVNITTLNVNTKATDAHGIAKSIKGALVTQMAGGPG
jgi:hypothetical protein